MGTQAGRGEFCREGGRVNVGEEGRERKGDGGMDWGRGDEAKVGGFSPFAGPLNGASALHLTTPNKIWTRPSRIAKSWPRIIGVNFHLEQNGSFN